MAEDEQIHQLQTTTAIIQVRGDPDQKVFKVEELELVVRFNRCHRQEWSLMSLHTTILVLEVLMVLIEANPMIGEAQDNLESKKLKKKITPIFLQELILEERVQVMVMEGNIPSIGMMMLFLGL